MVRYIVITAAMNSRRFMESFPVSAGGSSYLQASPSELNPPNPCSHASNIVVPVGLVNVMLLMLIPFVLTCCKSPIQSWRSSPPCLFGVCAPYFL